MVQRPDRLSYRANLPSSRDERRRKLSQNFLVNPEAVALLVDPLREDTSTPVIELAAGSGAVTRALIARGFHVTAVEFDPAWAEKLRREFKTRVSVVEQDLMQFPFPTAVHNVVSNVPFHLSTDLIRRLLGECGWKMAVLMLQWEVARKRAAVHGGTLLTASFWPWYEFTLAGRVPSRAFRPIPRVDSGILMIKRRDRPLVSQMAPYQELVQAVFTGRGRGLGQILKRWLSPSAFSSLAQTWAIDPHALPRDLNESQWAALYQAVSAEARSVQHSSPRPGRPLRTRRRKPRAG